MNRWVSALRLLDQVIEQDLPMLDRRGGSLRRRDTLASGISESVSTHRVIRRDGILRRKAEIVLGANRPSDRSEALRGHQLQADRENEQAMRVQRLTPDAAAKALRRLRRRKVPVVFVGAGISADSELPLARELKVEMFTRLIDRISLSRSGDPRQNWIRQLNGVMLEAVVEVFARQIPSISRSFAAVFRRGHGPWQVTVPMPVTQVEPNHRVEVAGRSDFLISADAEWQGRSLFDVGHLLLGYVEDRVIPKFRPLFI